MDLDQNLFDGAPFVTVADLADRWDIPQATVGEWQHHGLLPLDDLPAGEEPPEPVWLANQLAELDEARAEQDDLTRRELAVAIAEVQTPGRQLAVWIAAGTAPSARGRRLLQVLEAAQSAEGMVALLIESRLDVTCSLRAQLQRPAWPEPCRRHEDDELSPGEYARGLLFAAVLEQVSAFQPEFVLPSGWREG